VRKKAHPKKQHLKQEKNRHLKLKGEIAQKQQKLIRKKREVEGLLEGFNGDRCWNKNWSCAFGWEAILRGQGGPKKCEKVIGGKHEDELFEIRRLAD